MVEELYAIGLHPAELFPPLDIPALPPRLALTKPPPRLARFQELVDAVARAVTNGAMEALFETKVPLYALATPEAKRTRSEKFDGREPEE